MDWPERPVEQIPPGEFVPPHCPWPTCPTHRPGTGRRFRWHRHGVYVRRCDRRVVPRFRCLEGCPTFSQQTFACSYYLKRPELAVPVAAGLLAGSAHRQLARSLGCAPSTVTRLSARVGRHALLLLAHGLETLPGIVEPVVYDDFETFCVSQDLPCGLGTAVGQRSWFIYELEHAAHRRGGRPRRAHRRPCLHPAREPEPGAYSRAFGRMLDTLTAKLPGGRSLTLVTDGHPGYRSGLRRHRARRRVIHRTFANPERRPSQRARRRDRAMFAVDTLHALLRHSLAHHRRESIAFGRRLNALLERAFLAAVWRNWVKGRSERKPDPTTPAMWLGMTDRPWSWSKVLARRLFAWRIRVPAHWMTVYRRDLQTPEIGPNTRHRLARAF